MKLSKEALLEVVAIFQDGLLGKKDASHALRELDLVETNVVVGEKYDYAINETTTDYERQLSLSKEYVESHPRAGDWQEPEVKA